MIAYTELKIIEWDLFFIRKDLHAKNTMKSLLETSEHLRNYDIFGFMLSLSLQNVLKANRSISFIP